MRFSSFLLLETQTISQYLKSLQLNPQIVKDVRATVRQRLQTIPFFTAEGNRYLDLFTNFFSYIGLTRPESQNAIKAILTHNFVPENDPTNRIGFLKGYASNFNPLWQKWGDYIVNHVNDNRKMSQFNNTDYTPEQLDSDVEEWHHRLTLKQAKPGAPGRPILDVGNGWKWVSLDKEYCRQEGDAAGHCGNVAHKKGDNILSLRDPEDKVHLTFIVNNKILGESKGRGNSKPSPKYHAAIVKLLLSPYVDYILGGGYELENNFEFDDLDEETQKQIITQKPTFGMDFFDYVLKNQKGNLKDKIGKVFNHDVKRVYKKNKNTWVALETFDELKEIEEYLRNDSKRSSFSWIDDYIDIDIHVGRDEIDSALSYSIKPEIKIALEKYFVQPPDTIDPERWEDMDLDEKIEEEDGPVHDAFRGAIYSGYEVGTQDEAWKDVRNQLGREDENGFFINFDKHPWELTISLEALKNIYKEHRDAIESGDWMNETLKIKYDAPYNGYNDFSKDAFNERLMDELPREVTDLIIKPEEVKKGKKKKFKEWLEARDFNYLSVGHDFKGNFDAWILKRGADDIVLASQKKEDPEFFHDMARRVDYKGRIDHDKKTISIVNELSTDEERLNYLVSILKNDYPNYQIWLFGYGHPKQLS